MRTSPSNLAAGFESSSARILLMMGPMVFQEIRSSVATAVFVQDRESHVASSSNSLVKRELCLAHGTAAATTPFGAHDTWAICYDVDLMRIPVAGSPRTLTTATIIARGFSAATSATALLPLGRVHHDGDGSIRQNFHVIYDSMLDI